MEITIYKIKPKIQKVATYLLWTYQNLGSVLCPVSNVNLTMDETEIELILFGITEDKTVLFLSGPFIAIFPPDSFELISIKHETI